VFTFASGPTNSMRGAAFVSSVKDAIVLDIGMFQTLIIATKLYIGGTSTDVGMLIKGFPRLTGAHVYVSL
jgi:N-methylhydantoinase A/oxoprolinase/acetone carboxylase beta subunit